MAPNRIINDDKDPDFLRISVDPPFELGADVILTLSFTGNLGYHQTTGNSYNWTNIKPGDLFPSDGYNRVVTNYGNFVSMSEFGVEIRIERGLWDGLPVNCGLMERLEFDVA